MFFLFDPLYLILTGIGLVFSLWAQAKVKSTFNHYSQVATSAGMSGAEAAAAVCRAGQAGGIKIERHPGFLSDHYDPRSRTLRLSPDVYEGRSVSAVAVAAHEAGHAIQHATDYRWLGFRSSMVSMANIGNRMWALPFMLGMFLAFGQSPAAAGDGTRLGHAAVPDGGRHLPVRGAGRVPARDPAGRDRRLAAREAGPGRDRGSCAARRKPLASPRCSMPPPGPTSPRPPRASCS